MSRDIPGNPTDAYMQNTTVQFTTSYNLATFGCWIWVDAATNGSAFLTVPYPGSTKIPIALGIGDGTTGVAGRLFMGIFNGSAWAVISDTAAVPLAQWLHIFGTVNGTTMRLFRGGIQAVTGTGNATAAGPAGIIVGRRWDTTGTTRWLNGRMAHIALWNAVLNDDEILALSRGVSPLMFRNPNLLSYWPLWGTAFPEADLSPAGAARTLAQVGACAVGVENPPVGHFLPLAA